MALLNGASDETTFPRIPHYTVTSRTATPEEQAVLEQTLRLTPVRYALIFETRDVELAAHLGIPEILRVNSLAAAFHLADELYEIEDARSLIVTSEGASC